MRVLIYTLNYYPENVGVGKYSGEMVEWLKKKGIQCTVVTAQPYFPLWKASSYRYFFSEEIIRCPIWVPRKPNGVKRIIHLLSFSITSLPVLFCLAKKNYDLVFTVVPTIFCIPSALFFSNIFNKKSSTWLHFQDLEIEAAFSLKLIKGRILKKILLIIESFLINKFNKVSSISNEMCEKISEKLKNKKKLTYFPNWVDTSLLYPLKEKKDLLSKYFKEYKYFQNKKIVMYSGSMSKKQGMKFLADTIDNTLEQNSNLIWLLSGEGPSKNYLKDRFKNNKNVFIEGLKPFEELNQWLNLGDIHVVPQKNEASDLLLPSKITGILSIGKVVVATARKNSGIYKLCSKAGIMVEPGDSNAFANAILKLSCDEKLCSEMGSKGREIALSQLDKNKVLKKFLKEIKLLISS